MMNTEHNDCVDRAQFIKSMRMVASSVTVVTTAGSAGRHGATVSAFCSVSADPPTALICLHEQSTIAKLVRENGAFAINVLPQGTEGLAVRFAGAEDDRRSDRFDGLDCLTDPLPLISGATALSCRVTESMLSGSHRIFIGHVFDVCHGSKPPLAYYDGVYHRVIPQGLSCQEGLQ